MSTEVTTTITITEEQLDACIARALRTRSWDEDEECWRYTPVDIQHYVKARVDHLIKAEVAATAFDVARTAVEARVDRILDEGFPAHNQWGESKGVKTLAAVVGEIVFTTNHGSSLKDRVHTAVRESVRSEVAKYIRGISADIDKSMKAAAAEALASWMKKTIGVRS